MYFTQAKNHEHNLQTIENGAAQRRQNIEQTFELERRSLRAETDRSDTEHLEQLAIAKSDRATRLTQAMELQDQTLTKAQSDLEVAEFTGRTEKASLVQKTKLDCERRVREAMKECKVELTAAEAARDAAINVAEAREAQATAAGKAAQLKEDLTRHHQRLRLAEIDAQFASRGRHVIQGDGGAAILGAFHGAARAVAAPNAASMKRD